MLEPLEHLRELVPYPLPDTSNQGDDGMLQLAQNENALGASPLALAAARDACAGSALYPDPDASALRMALADRYGIDAERIVCARGSMELIGLLAAAYLAPGSSAVVSEYGYLFFRSATRIAGARLLSADEPALRVDVDTVCAATRGDTRIVWLANPGNPTGSYLPVQDVHRLRAALPENVLLVIDEAYVEFLGERVQAANLALVEESATVVLRTFSKLYGLAGLRVGWGYFPAATATVMRTLLQPNAVTGPAQAAAIAALHDTGYARTVRERTISTARAFAERIGACGLEALPTHGNFMLVRFAGAADAAAANLHLRRAAIAVRPMQAYRLADCLRVTIGTEAQMARVVSAIEEWSHTS